MIKSFKEYYVTYSSDTHRTANRKAWANIRFDLRLANPNDSNELFQAVIKRMQWYLGQTGSIDSISDMYYSFASEFVNNSRSKFYIYG